MRGRTSCICSVCTYIAYVASRRNYTYKEHTRRRQVTVAPARRTDSRRVLLDDAPVDGRTDERTDAHIPVIVLSQEEAGSALSASLALDSYRRMFPTRSPSLVIFLSRALPFVFPFCSPLLPSYALFYCAVCESSGPTLFVRRTDQRKPVNVIIMIIMIKNV